MSIFADRIKRRELNDKEQPSKEFLCTSLVKKKSAFSLMEMLIVMLIVAIVMAIQSPMVAKKQTKVTIRPIWAQLTGGHISWNRHARNLSAIIGGKYADAEAMKSGTVDSNYSGLVINTNNENPQIAFSYDDGSGAQPRGNLYINKGIYIGNNIISSGANAIAIGQNVNTGSAKDSVAFGFESSVSGAGGTAIGAKTKAGATNATALGANAKAAGQYSVAIGNANVPSAKGGVAIGYNSKASGAEYPIAIGKNAQMAGWSIGAAIGHGANTGYTKCSTVIGNNARATGNTAIALGSDAKASASSVVAGTNANSSMYSVALGYNANASKSSSIAIGTGANTYSGSYPIAIGTGANTLASHTIALGTNAKASSANSVAIGADAKASSQYAYALGVNANVLSAHTNAIAIGYKAKSKVANDVVIGAEPNTKVTTDSVVFGVLAGPSSANLSNSVAIGYGATYRTADTIAIGYNAAPATSGIAIGHYASTKNYGTAIGKSSVAYPYSFAIGNEANAGGSNSVAIGKGARTENNERVLAIGAGSEAAGIDSISLMADIDNAVGRFSSLQGGNSNVIVLGGNDTTVYVPGQFTAGSITYENIHVKGSLWVSNHLVTLKGAALGAFVQSGPRYDNAGDEDWGYRYNHAVSWIKEFEDQGYNKTMSMAVYGGEYESGHGRTKQEECYKIADRYDLSNWCTYLSDRRLKDIIGENLDAMDKINRLKVYDYKYKNSPVPHVGVMAQHLKKVFPNAVSKDEKGFLQIRHEEIFYAMVNALKQLDAKVKQLAADLAENIKLVTSNEAKINARDKELKELKQELAQLREMAKQLPQ